MTGINIGGIAVALPDYVPYENNLDQLWWAPQAGGSPFMVVDKASGLRVATPAASPDYSQIAYLYNGGGPERLWIVNRDGTGDTQLLAQSCTYPDWHPDGSHIIFCSFDNPGLIDRINPDGTGHTTIYDSGGNQLRRAIYNRDGTLIAFYDDAADEVWVIEADGSNPTKVGDLVSGAVNENAISWMHSSDVLAWGDGDLNLYRVDADGSNLTTLVTFTFPDDGFCSRRAWSADDSIFFFVKFDNPSGHYTLWSCDATGSGAAQVSPAFGIFRWPPFVFANRVYADGENAPGPGALGLTSILTDGSDFRVDDGSGPVRLEFPI